ncbi:hypothetical protein GCM10014713_02810 [Streptomyces purpureus]|uniref:DUF3592 domain-containing protein n=1 Tax=Streptomyces purpureus TaxID=1951 RepID=A0A918GXR1_9ACTN|nr:hypothetical protein GCM10014713_02810 [Streptomyces purpureus]
MRKRLVDRLLGPAAYEGSPPLWLVTEGLVVAGVGAGLIVSAGVLSVLAGMSPSKTAGAVAVATAAVALYLLITRAGHVFVAGVAVLGALLASGVSGVVAEAVLTGAGRTQDVVVTTVAHEPAGNPAYYCSVRRQDGSPVEARLWRGCGPSVNPGDLIGMVYDPAGRVAPRGVDGPGSLVRGLAMTAVLLLAFTVLCLLAVVRSYRVPSTRSGQPSG